VKRAVCVGVRERRAVHRLIAGESFGKAVERCLLEEMGGYVRPETIDVLSESLVRWDEIVDSPSFPTLTTQYVPTAHTMATLSTRASVHASQRGVCTVCGAAGTSCTSSAPSFATCPTAPSKRARASASATCGSGAPTATARSCAKPSTLTVATCGLST
jgi:hypothetical protein